MAVGLGVKHQGGRPFTVHDFLTRRGAPVNAGSSGATAASGGAPASTPATSWEVQYGSVVLLNNFAGGADLRVHRRALMAEGWGVDESLTEVLRRHRLGWYDQPAQPEPEIPRERLSSM